MAKLPDDFSLQAIPIRSALQEGRTDDAITLVVAVLQAGNADKVVQRIAAELLKPGPRPRGRRKALTRHWFEIGEAFHRMREDGTGYEEALHLTAKRFGYSETHCRKAIVEFEAAKAASDEMDCD